MLSYNPPTSHDVATHKPSPKQFNLPAGIYWYKRARTPSLQTTDPGCPWLFRLG